MTTQYRKYISTTIVPATGVITTKTVLTGAVGETEVQRGKRLGKQYAANHGHIKFLGGVAGSRKWSVPSQRRGSDNKPVCHYEVVEVNGELMCECDFGGWYPGKACSHTSQVRKYAERNGLKFEPAPVQRKVRQERE